MAVGSRPSFADADGGAVVECDEIRADYIEAAHAAPQPPPAAAAVATVRADILHGELRSRKRAPTMNDLSAVADDDERIAALLASLTLKEKLGQMAARLAHVSQNQETVDMQALASHSPGGPRRCARAPEPNEPAGGVRTRGPWPAARATRARRPPRRRAAAHRQRQRARPRQPARRDAFPHWAAAWAIRARRGARAAELPRVARVRHQLDVRAVLHGARRFALGSDVRGVFGGPGRRRRARGGGGARDPNVRRAHGGLRQTLGGRRRDGARHRHQGL